MAAILRTLGVAYRLQNRDLPGSPDFANRKNRWAVFAHGCFWHAHPGCPRATIPKNNREFWADKLEKNRERDARVLAELETKGFRVLVVWACELDREAERVAESLAAHCGGRPKSERREA